MSQKSSLPQTLKSVSKVLTPDMQNSNSIRHLWVPTGALKPYGKHARQHNRAQRRKIAALVQQIGTQPVPIIVTPEFEIVDGHGLWATLRETGADQVFVAVLQNQSAAEIRALRLAINRIPEEAKWDKARLRSEVGELVDLSFDMELTGFDAAEIDSLLRLDLPEAGLLEDEGAIPPLSSTPIARLGDIFELGQHRIGCGDAHDHVFVERVRNGRVADMCFTDPPYNIRIEGFASGKGRVHHREFVKACGELSSQEFFTFFNSSLDVVRGSCHSMP